MDNFSENALSEIILGKCIKIHKAPGAGLFESVYEEVLMYELKKEGIIFRNQVTIPVFYDNIKMEKGFIADLIVENKVIIEVKSVEKVLPVHKKQVLTYLKLTGIKLGLLINFNENLLKDGITRVVNNL